MDHTHLTVGIDTNDDILTTPTQDHHLAYIQITDPFLNRMENPTTNSTPTELSSLLQTVDWDTVTPEQWTRYTYELEHNRIIDNIMHTITSIDYTITITPPIQGTDTINTIGNLYQQLTSQITDTATHSS